MTTRTNIEEALGEDSKALFADGFDDAIIGVCEGPSFAIVAYSRRKCLDVLVGQGMDEFEAEEYFEFNVEQAYLGEGTPKFIDDSFVEES